MAKEPLEKKLLKATDKLRKNMDSRIQACGAGPHIPQVYIRRV